MLLVSIPFDVHAFLGLGRGDGSDWRFEVYLGEDVVFECSLDSPNANVVSITYASLTCAALIFTNIYLC